MALTAQEKADIVYHLGWPGLTIVQGSTDYSKIIVDRITNISSPMEIQIRALLDRIVALETKLSAASCRLSAKKIGDIELRDDEIHQLKREKRRGLKELSKLLDIELLMPSGANVTVSI